MHRGACKPGSVPGVVSQYRDLTPRRQPFLLATRCHAAPATNPGCRGPKQTCQRAFRPLARSPYSVLLRVGFALPLAVTGSAVRSCRTLSPLPVPKDVGGLLSVALSLSFPLPVQESPGGRYPPPLFRGARTFLVIPKDAAAARPPGASGHLARPVSRSNRSSKRIPPIWPSISPSRISGRQRRWKASTAARPSVMS